MKKDLALFGGRRDHLAARVVGKGGGEAAEQRDGRGGGVGGQRRGGGCRGGGRGVAEEARLPRVRRHHARGGRGGHEVVRQGRRLCIALRHLPPVFARQVVHHLPPAWREGITR